MTRASHFVVTVFQGRLARLDEPKIGRDEFET